MQKKHRETEQKLAQALKGADSLKVKLGKAEKGLEEAKFQLAATRSELDQEKKGVAKLREDHAIELSGTVIRERKKDVRDFIFSERFAEDVALRNQPIFQIAATRALNQMKSLNPPGFNLANFKDYNPQPRRSWTGSLTSTAMGMP